MKKFFLFFLFLFSFFGFSFSDSACDYYSGVSSLYFIGNVDLHDDVPLAIKDKYHLALPNRLYVGSGSAGPGTAIYYKFFYNTGFFTVGFNTFDAGNDFAFKLLRDGTVRLFVCGSSADYPLDLLKYSLNVNFVDSSEPYIVFNLKMTRKDNIDGLNFESSNRFYLDVSSSRGIDVSNYSLGNGLVYLGDRQYLFSGYILQGKYYIADFSGSKYYSLDLYSKNVPFNSMTIRYDRSVSDSFIYNKFTFINSGAQLDWLNFVLDNDYLSGSNDFYYGSGVISGGGYSGLLNLSNFDFLTCPFFDGGSVFRTFNFSLRSLFPDFFEDSIVGAIIPDFISNFDFLGFITCPVNGVFNAWHDSKDFIPFSSLFVSSSSLNRNLYVSVSDDQFDKFSYLLNIVLVSILFISLFLYLVK